MANLGVNIDHVATLREARRTIEPDPVNAVALVERGGATSVVIHLREDRRHIKDRDLDLIRQVVRIKLDLEMATDPEIVEIALAAKPDIVTMVPERREELTTEGGLDVAGQLDRLTKIVTQFHDEGIETSLFVDPVVAQLEASAATGTGFVELHTGVYAEAWIHRDREQVKKELDNLCEMSSWASEHGLKVNAGHGLTYQNTAPVAAIPQVEELNIGHSIMARAVFVGLEEAVRDMLAIIMGAT